MYILKITGLYTSARDKSPESTIADMLRYDDGELVNWTNLGPPFPGSKAHSKFQAEVHSNSFTPQRWSSFGLKAEIVRKEPGKASSSYPDMTSVQEAFYEHR